MLLLVVLTLTISMLLFTWAADMSTALSTGQVELEELVKMAKTLSFRREANSVISLNLKEISKLKWMLVTLYLIPKTKLRKTMTLISPGLLRDPTNNTPKVLPTKKRTLS